MVLCSICMVDYDLTQVQKIEKCHCIYCKECLFEYLKFEIMAGTYKITCPDAKCPKYGIFGLLEIVPGYRNEFDRPQEKIGKGMFL